MWTFPVSSWRFGPSSRKEMSGREEAYVARNGVVKLVWRLDGMPRHLVFLWGFCYSVDLAILCHKKEICLFFSLFLLIFCSRLGAHISSWVCCLPLTMKMGREKKKEEWGLYTRIVSRACSIAGVDRVVIRSKRRVAARAMWERTYRTLSDPFFFCCFEVNVGGWKCFECFFAE